MAIPLPSLSLNPLMGPPMTHRFAVFFFANGRTANPLDIRFQEVSDLRATITTRPDTSADASLSKKLIPSGIDYDALELKRGLVLGSVLERQIESAFNDFKFVRSDVLLTIFSESGLPTTAFLFSEAFPISWQLGSLNAKTEDFLIETLNLSYSRMRTVTL